MPQRFICVALKPVFGTLCNCKVNSCRLYVAVAKAVLIVATLFITCSCCVSASKLFSETRECNSIVMAQVYKPHPIINTALSESKNWKCSRHETRRWWPLRPMVTNQTCTFATAPWHFPESHCCKQMSLSLWNHSNIWIRNSTARFFGCLTCFSLSTLNAACCTVSGNLQIHLNPAQ